MLKTFQHFEILIIQTSYVRNRFMSVNQVRFVNKILKFYLLFKTQVDKLYLQLESQTFLKLETFVLKLKIF